MPVKSYILYPKLNERESLIQSLQEFPACEISEADNSELLVLVTDTEDDASDDKLLATIQSLESLDHISLVASFNTIPS